MYSKQFVLIALILLLALSCAPKDPGSMALEAGKQILSNRFITAEGAKFNEVSVIADTTVDGTEWFLLFADFEAQIPGGEMAKFQYYVSLKFENGDYQNPVYDETRSIKTCNMSKEQCIGMMKSLNQWPGFEWQETENEAEETSEPAEQEEVETE